MNRFSNTFNTLFKDPPQFATIELLNLDGPQSACTANVTLHNLRKTADPAIVSRFDAWLPALLHILLEVYDPLGEALNDLPTSMKDWRHQLSVQDNPVAEWLEDIVELTDNGKDRTALDKGLVTSLYTRYKADNCDGDMNRDTFLTCLKRYLSSKGVFKDELNIKQPDGKHKNCKNVLWKARFLTE